MATWLSHIYEFYYVPEQKNKHYVSGFYREEMEFYEFAEKRWNETRDRALNYIYENGHEHLLDMNGHKEYFSHHVLPPCKSLTLKGEWENYSFEQCAFDSVEELKLVLNKTKPFPPEPFYYHSLYDEQGQIITQLPKAWTLWVSLKDGLETVDWTKEGF